MMSSSLPPGDVDICESGGNSGIGNVVGAVDDASVGGGTVVTVAGTAGTGLVVTPTELVPLVPIPDTYVDGRVLLAWNRFRKNELAIHSFSLLKKKFVGVDFA